MPVHFVPGNHDIFSDETASIYTNRFGPLLSLAEYEGVEFVFIYTEAIAKGVAGDGCRYKLLEEFDGLLQNLPPDQPVIVFHHRPSIGWGRSAEAAQRWQELLNRHDVKAVIAGHFHCDEMHWLGRVPLYIGPPLSGRIGRQAAFRIYEYCDGNLGYRTQYLD
jgi:calcineurin-like phosphoesterase family protein